MGKINYDDPLYYYDSTDSSNTIMNTYRILGSEECKFSKLNDETGETEKWYRIINKRKLKGSSEETAEIVYVRRLYDKNDELIEQKVVTLDEYTTAHRNYLDTYSTEVDNFTSAGNNGEAINTYAVNNTQDEQLISTEFKYNYIDRLSIFENKLKTNWKDLDDNLYHNHFSNGQCYMKVSFNREFEKSEDDINNEPLETNLPIYPEDISFNGSTNYASAEILGRPGTISGYVNTSDITTRIHLHLHRELKIPGNVDSDKNQIDKIIALMQACNYPKLFANGLAVPIVTYVFGDTIITGKQTSFTTKWSGPKIGNSYMDVTVDIAITHVSHGILFFDDIRGFNPRQFM